MAKRPTSRSTYESGDEVRRGFRRLPVLWSAKLQRGGEQIACTILNLSPGGAKLQLPDIDPCPARVRIESPRFGQLNGRVVWRRHDLVGLAFVEGPVAVAAAVGHLLGNPVPVLSAS